jgi:hypothetical protein
MRDACGSDAAYYAWEDYRAVRRGRYLLIERDPDTTAGRCDLRSGLFRLERQRLQPLDAPRRLARLRAMIADRLGDRERAYLAGRWGIPAAPFLVRADGWDVDPTAVPCVPVGVDTAQASLTGSAWLWTGRGVACLASEGPAVTLTVPVPPGSYRVEVGANPVARPPWLFGGARWRKRSFLSDDPTEFVALGTLDAPTGRLRVPLSAAALARRHLLALRLSPPSMAPPTALPEALDPAQRERLRALGYVQ